MLCRHGGGIAAIAGPFCQAVTDLIGADAGMMMWFSADGAPQGFYHQTAPAEVKDLFATKLDDDFNQTEPVSGYSLAKGPGPRVGRMLAPGMQELFETGNIYKHLCAPIGHRYLLDMSAETAEGAAAAFFAWNPPGRPFRKQDAEALEPVQPLLECAFRTNPENSHWISHTRGTPHLIATNDGRKLLAIDAQAERLLSESNLLRQGISPLQQLRHSPGFLQPIAGLLADQDRCQLVLPVANGRLVCHAEKTRFLSEVNADEFNIFVGLDLQASISALQIGAIANFDLTAMQAEILFLAMQGKARIACQAELGVGEAAMKKHLQAIFLATQTASWNDLKHLGQSCLENFVG